MKGKLKKKLMLMVNGGRADYMGVGCEEAKIFYNIL